MYPSPISPFPHFGFFSIFDWGYACLDAKQTKIIILK